jgi:NADPH:quinone reductase-like Zn-dependent oxidoreductase
MFPQRGHGDRDAVGHFPSSPQLSHMVRLDPTLCSEPRSDPKVLKLVPPFDSAPRGETRIFIYGGSTCVGLHAILFAKLSGYKIATVASPRNHELPKNYGADVVFDMNECGEGCVYVVKIRLC